MKLFLSLIFFSLNSFAGTEMGNGGDAVLQEFNLRGMQIGLYLKGNPQVAAQFAIDPDKFIQIVKTVLLEGKDQLFLRGVEVDAINYPVSGKIEVSRTRWQANGKQSNAFLIQRRIALHEYLWMYGIDDTNYAVSNPIISDLENHMGPAIDKDVRELLQNKVCAAIAVLNINLLKANIGWGLDLNANCKAFGPGSDEMTPAQYLMESIWIQNDPKNIPIRREITRELLVHGMNPNFQIENRISKSLLLSLLTADFELGKIALEFGADPNAQTNAKMTIFGQLAQSTWGISADQVYKMDVRMLRTLIDFGGDVNQFVQDESFARSPARILVQKEDNAEVVEALIQTGKVDWCTKTQEYFGERVIDAVRDEYLPLLQKFKVSCP